MVALLVGLLLLVGTSAVFGILLFGRARERDLARRVDLIMHVPSRNASSSKPAAISTWRSRALDGLRALFGFRMRQSWGTSTSPVYLLLIGVVAAAAVWVLTRIFSHLPDYMAAGGGALAFFLLPRIILMLEQHRSAAQFAELLPDAIDMVVRIVRAGLPIGNAIRTVGQEANPPLDRVFAAIADQTEIGIPLDQAMETTSSQIGNPDFRFFAVAVSLQQATGGNLAETLETLSQIIRKRRTVRLKARAATAEVRISAIVLGSVPFFITGALLMVAPNYLNPLFADPRGNIILGLAIFDLLLAGFTMRAMIRHSLMV